MHGYIDDYKNILRTVEALYFPVFRTIQGNREDRTEATTHPPRSLVISSAGAIVQYAPIGVVSFSAPFALLDVGWAARPDCI